jgi:heme-degrading monooxygenase HmoA
MKTRMATTMAFLCVVALVQGRPQLADLEARAKSQPDNLSLWLELGQAQFRAARGNDAVLLEAAQASFEQVLRVNANEPRALVWHGTLLSMKAGKLFQSGKLDEAQSLLTRGFDEMDRGVKASPEDTLLRRVRGETNLRVPEFLGRTALGVEDFERVIADPSFNQMPAGEKAQIQLLLGTGYSRAGEPDRARLMWQKAVEAAPESNAAREAQKHLNLTNSGNSANSRPDRLTDIPDDVSPIMAVATARFKSEAVNSQPAFSRDVEEMFRAMERAPGFMGMRLLQSADKPPMFVAISWWKDRKALVDWYYNPAHQKMVAGFSAGSGGSSEPGSDKFGHIGLQFYSLLRGGMSLGGSFGPTRKPVE